MSAYLKLKAIFQQYYHLQHVAAICQWDEAVMMPTGGGEARAEAMATLLGLSHQLLTTAQVGDLLLAAKQEALSDPWDASNLRLMEHKFKSESCLPEELVKQSTRAFLLCEQAWRYLRPRNDWATFSSLLQKNVDFIKEIATCKSQVFACDPYDALLDSHSPGVSQQLINPLFKDLERRLPHMIVERMAKQALRPSFVGHYALKSQRKLSLAIMRILGFDFNHGRLDTSHHPFCGGAPQDVRITTRYQKSEFVSSIMAVCHETGHGLYERGLPVAWLDQPVGQPLGMAMHESQSLLMEMQICQSESFLTCLAPLINKYLAPQPRVTREQLYAYLTHVQPGYIRVDADEMCYPLHVILRYEIERLLIAGNIEVAELPDLWDHYMQQFFSLSTKDNYKDGIMQDVHWAGGAFGYFPAYTLGAIIAAQLVAALRGVYFDLEEDISQGKLQHLNNWLAQHVHQLGSSLSLSALIQQATTKPLRADSFVMHLQCRYGDAKI